MSFLMTRQMSMVAVPEVRCFGEWINMLGRSIYERVIDQMTDLFSLLFYKPKFEHFQLA